MGNSAVAKVHNFEWQFVEAVRKLSHGNQRTIGLNGGSLRLRNTSFDFVGRDAIKLHATLGVPGNGNRCAVKFGHSVPA